MITVIGGSGFIGTRLCHLLNDQNIPFEIIDLKASNSFPERTKVGDIREYESFRSLVAGKIIILLAAVHRDDVKDHREYYNTNVDGTRNVCRVAEEIGVENIVFTSTVAVYGFADADTGEDGAIDPFNDYGKSKVEGEIVLNDWFNQGEADRALTIVRPTVVFGEGNRGNVFNLLNQISSGKFVMVGNGRNRKSMAYVGNIAAFLKYVAETPNGRRVSNYVDKQDFDMNTLVSHTQQVLTGKSVIGLRISFPVGLCLGYVADAVARITGKTLPISSIRVRKFCATTAFATAAFDKLGFSAPFSLEQGLSRTLKSEFLEPDPNREIFFTE